MGTVRNANVDRWEGRRARSWDARKEKEAKAIIRAGNWEKARGERENTNRGWWKVVKKVREVGIREEKRQRKYDAGTATCQARRRGRRPILNENNHRFRHEGKRPSPGGPGWPGKGGHRKERIKGPINIHNNGGGAGFLSYRQTGNKNQGPC